jgi:hypothetical protein
MTSVTKSGRHGAINDNSATAASGDVLSFTTLIASTCAMV